MQSAEHKTQHASWRVDVAENVYTSLYGPGCVLREEASFLGEVKPPAWSPNTGALPTEFGSYFKHVGFGIFKVWFHVKVNVKAKSGFIFPPPGYCFALLGAVSLSMKTKTWQRNFRQANERRPLRRRVMVANFLALTP